MYCTCDWEYCCLIICHCGLSLSLCLIYYLGRFSRDGLPHTLHYTYYTIHSVIFNIFKSVRNNAFKVNFVNIILRFPLFVSTAVNSIISTEWRAYCLLMFLFFHYFYNDKRAIQFICHDHNYAVYRNVTEPRENTVRCRIMWYEFNYYFAYTSARTFSP